LTRRLFSLGAIQPIDFLERVVPAIRSWLVELLQDNMPEKADVVLWVRQAMRQVLDSTRWPFADEFLDAAALEAIVKLTDSLYDQIANLDRSQFGL
jgi:hypothetical protein